MPLCAVIMRWAFALPFGTLALVVLYPLAAKPDPVKPTATHTKLTHTSTHGSAAKGSRVNSAASRSHSASKTTRRGRRSAPAPSYQVHPDPERYQAIQQALADRGYFKGEVNGTWGADSVDALQRFQADQKLDNDGKINALTLIGLGLGPKHDGSLASSKPATDAPSAAAPNF